MYALIVLYKKEKCDGLNAQSVHDGEAGRERRRVEVRQAGWVENG